MQALGLVAPLLSTVGGLFGKSSASKVQQPQMFQPPNMTGAANTAYDTINSFAGTAPQGMATGQQLYNNPYVGQTQQGAQGGANLGMGGALDAYSAGLGLSGNAQTMLPFASQIMSTGFDPQGDLYAREYQKMIDQQRAAQGVRGIQTTPYGAGLENDASRNFNLDWQDRMLGRQSTASGAAGQLINSAGRNIIGGEGLAAGAAPAFMESSAYPYSTYNTIGTNAISGLNAGMQPGQNVIADLLQYLQSGNQASGVANQNASNQLAQQNSIFSQNQTLGSNFGSGISGITNYLNSLYGMPGSYNGTGMY
jgi:hypothetical protein